MVLLQFLEIIEVFGDYPWVEYLCHAFIMPSTKRNGMTYEFLRTPSIRSSQNYPSRYLGEYGCQGLVSQDRMGKPRCAADLYGGRFASGEKGKGMQRGKEVYTDEEEDNRVVGHRDDATYYCVSGDGRASCCCRLWAAHGPS
jgi:hypothetical protein